VNDLNTHPPTNPTFGVTDGGSNAKTSIEKAPTTRQPKLLDQVRQAIRTRHYSYRTEKAYVHWIKRFIFFHDSKTGMISEQSRSYCGTTTSVLYTCFEPRRERSPKSARSPDNCRRFWSGSGILGFRRPVYDGTSGLQKCLTRLFIGSTNFWKSSIADLSTHKLDGSVRIMQTRTHSFAVFLLVGLAGAFVTAFIFIAVVQLTLPLMPPNHSVEATTTNHVAGACRMVIVRSDSLRTSRTCGRASPLR
jgi:integrase-like protein